MPGVQIKDVPDETLRVLRRRAAGAHLSSQENPRAESIDEAARPTVDEILALASEQTVGAATTSDIVDQLRADRGRH